MEGEAKAGGRLRASADGGQDAVRGHPGRDRQVQLGMQAVKQAADESEHVHHRGERHDAFATARDAVYLRIALYLLDEARSVTSDDLGGTRRGGTALYADRRR